MADDVVERQADQSLALGEGYFVNYYPAKFGTYDPSHERLQRQYYAEKPGYALTETQYFGFYVPEHNLHCFTWVWAHPHLDQVMAGTMSWYGVKKFQVGCELFDFRAHMSMEAFNDDWPNARFDNSLSIEMLENGRAFRLRYDDPVRGNGFDVMQRGAAEVMMWPSDKHFEQVMHATGQVTLGGVRHEVDCYSVRDRSWGEYRLEDPMSIPPNSWVTANFGPGLSLHFTGMDAEDLDPVWKGKFKVDPSSQLRFGWVVADGRRAPAKSVRSRTDYDPVSLHPTGMTFDLEDELGRRFQARGKVLASTPFQAWPNMLCVVCLIEWEMDGRKGYGEIQNIQFSDFVRAMTGG
jgi:hypothetical protein